MVSLIPRKTLAASSLSPSTRTSITSTDSLSQGSGAKGPGGVDDVGVVGAESFGEGAAKIEGRLVVEGI